MPILSRFYGIIIRMYYAQSEHNPPHIHASYGDSAATVNISVTAKYLMEICPQKRCQWYKNGLQSTTRNC